MASWKNREKVSAILKRLPAAVKAAVGKQLETEAKDLAAAIQRAAPVAHDLKKRPGALRDSVHAYPNEKRELSQKVIADARDEKGRFIGQHVEFGHLAPNGAHVPAVPFFFPTYRARKKPMKRRLAKAGREAIKRAAAEPFEAE